MHTNLPLPLGEVPQCAHWGGEGIDTDNTLSVKNQRFLPALPKGERNLSLWGSDGSAACGRASDLSEWQGPMGDDAASAARRTSRVPTGSLGGRLEAGVQGNKTHRHRQASRSVPPRAGSFVSFLPEQERHPPEACCRFAALYRGIATSQKTGHSEPVRTLAWESPS